MDDRELTQLQETGSVAVGGPGGGESVSLGEVLAALDTLGIDPKTVELWSNDPIVIGVAEES